jgi:hypothetical protein
MLPENASREYADRSKLWNAIEKVSKRKDSRTAREIEVAIPIEFNRPESITVIRDYVSQNFVKEGMCADIAIHDNDGNPHAHIMLTTRTVDKDGFGSTNRDWNKREHLQNWRENWANVCNEHLKIKGYRERIDHRTLKAQGIDREPTKHEGVSVRNMEKRGIETERGRTNKEIRRRNQEKAEIERQIKELEQQRREELKRIAGKSSIWERLREVEQQSREQVQREREEIRANRKPLDIDEIARKAQERQIAELGERTPSEREELKRIAGKSNAFNRLWERALQPRDQAQSETKRASREPVDIAEIAKKAQARQILEFREREKQRVKERERER